MRSEMHDNIRILMPSICTIYILFKNYKNIKCMTKKQEVIKIDQAVLESTK